MENTKFIQLILEETGATNVRDIEYDKYSDRWIITFKNGLPQQPFVAFDDLYEFLLNG